MTIIAAADGSALGNPGPAGWAWYIDDDRWARGGWAHGTNNMGELTAVLNLLQQTAHLDEDLLVYCDSKYVIDSITKWMPGWKKRGWRKKDGKPVLNVELMKSLDAATAGRLIRFEWVKGHAGHPLNEAADRLANGAAIAWSTGVAPAGGPGIPGARPAPPAPAGQVAGAGNPDRGATTGGSTRAEPDLFSTLLDQGHESAAPGRPTERPAAPPASSNPGQCPPECGEQVIALERSLLTDEVRADTALVATLLHPDWQEIGSSGRMWTRAQMLAEIAPLPPTTMDVLTLTPLGPHAVLLLWRSVAESGNMLRSSWWVHDGERWRQRFHQGTREG